MSNPKYTEEQKQDYYRRLHLIEEVIPANYSTVLHGQLGLSKDIIRNVRQGKTINFTILEALESLCRLALTTSSVS